VCQWNLAQLANALLAAGLAGREPLEAALATYAEDVVSEHNARMAAKMGLKAYDKTLVRCCFFRLGP
jgi:uncharacterized protein YdiU (UPF0061 family)